MNTQTVLRVGAAAILAIGAALAPLAFMPEALAAPMTLCPGAGTPAPGSTVKGGLEVDGVCSVTDVTVDGGIVVDGNGHLVFVDSVAKGGITVNSGGELDINHDIGQSPLGSGGRVEGGIVMTNPVDFDLWATTINGGVQLIGDSTGSAPTVCGSTVNGDVDMSNATTGGIFIGDPTDNPTFATAPCSANRIHGGVTFSNVNSGAVEGNTIDGSVVLDASSVEFNGNTITGSSTCSNGTVIVAGEATDPASNSCS